MLHQGPHRDLNTIEQEVDAMVSSAPTMRYGENAHELLKDYATRCSQAAQLANRLCEELEAAGGDRSMGILQRVPSEKEKACIDFRMKYSYHAQVAETTRLWLNKNGTTSIPAPEHAASLEEIIEVAREHHMRNFETFPNCNTDFYTTELALKLQSLIVGYAQS